MGENKISQSKESYVCMKPCTKQEISLSQKKGTSAKIDQEGSFSRLLQAYLISLPPKTRNKFYKKSSFCAYHWVCDHSTNDFKALSTKIQHLKDCGALHCWGT